MWWKIASENEYFHHVEPTVLRQFSHLSAERLVSLAPSGHLAGVIIVRILVAEVIALF